LEVRVIGWLPAIAFYWTLAALYLGGAAIHIEGGGGGRQLLGLFLHFGVFLLIFAVARALLGAVLPAALGVGLGVVVAAALLPITAKLTFRLVGVRITSSWVPADEASA
jgi:hypothetical protein